MTLLRRNLLKLTAAAALSFGASATMSLAQDVTLRLHQFLPPQANVPKNIIIPWIEKIQEASDGRIKIDHFPSMQLGGKPPELKPSMVSRTSFGPYLDIRQVVFRIRKSLSFRL